MLAISSSNTTAESVFFTAPLLVMLHQFPRWGEGGRVCVRKVERAISNTCTPCALDSVNLLPGVKIQAASCWSVVRQGAGSWEWTFSCRRSSLATYTGTSWADAPRLTGTHLAHAYLGVPQCRSAFALAVAWPQPSCLCRGAASVSSVCSLLMASSSFAKFCTGLPGTGSSGTSVKRSKTMSGTTPDGFSGGTIPAEIITD